MVEAILHSLCASKQPPHEHLFHRLWGPVMEACSRLILVSSSQSEARGTAENFAGTGRDDAEGSMSYSEECRTVVQGLEAAGFQAAQVCSHTSRML